MKKKLLFIIPAALLIGFLLIKPPAIGKEKGDVIVTPQTTITPSAKPNLRDFDDEGRRPEHFEDHARNHDGPRDGDHSDRHDHEDAHDEEDD